MNRPTRTELYLQIAHIISHRATCQRGRVGAVIIRDNRIISTGYNGPLGDIECKNKCDLRLSCQHSIHAEANAIAFAAKVGIALDGSSLFCTTSPCIKCAELIIQSGIVKVFYTSRYRDISGISMLEESLVQCILSDIQYDFYEQIQDDSITEGGQ